MHLIFLKEERRRTEEDAGMFEKDVEQRRPLWKDMVFFASMVGFLVFANWARPIEDTGVWAVIFSAKWVVAGIFLILAVMSVFRWYHDEERKEWYSSTWDFALKILPLLFGGVLVAGFLLGRPGKSQSSASWDKS